MGLVLPRPSLFLSLYIYISILLFTLLHAFISVPRFFRPGLCSLLTAIFIKIYVFGAVW